MDQVSDTHHLNLSILTNTVELNLLIGQSIVQSLLGGCLNMGCFFRDASLWIEEQAVWSLMHLCTMEVSKCICMQLMQLVQLIPVYIRNKDVCLKHKTHTHKSTHPCMIHARLC